MKTKLAIGAAAALLLGVYLFRFRRPATPSAPKAPGLRPDLFDQLQDPYPDPSGDLGIEVCSPSQSYACASDNYHPWWSP